MTEQTKSATPDEKIVHTAKSWRQQDKLAIANKGDGQLRSAEYRARKELRKVIDQAGGEH